jgi:hypothetical protein
MSSYIIIIMRFCWPYSDEHTLFFGLVKSKCNDKHMFKNTCKALLRGDGAEQTSLCVVIDQPVGNPKRKV